MSGRDDTSYFALAVDVIDGTFTTEFEVDGSFPFRFRSGLIFPTALMFALFGVSEASAAILPLLASLATIWLCWLLGRRLSVTTGLIAAGLMATFPLAITLGTSLAPSPFAGFLTGLSVLLWLRADQDEHRNTTNSVLLFAGSGLALGSAYLFRIETGLVALFFGAYLLWQRRVEAGWLVAGTAALFVVLAENFAYFLTNGIWLYRLKVLSGSFASMESQITVTLDSQRALSEYFEMMFLRPNDLGLHWVLILPGALLCVFLRSRARTPFLLWFWPVMLYLMFGSWSLTEYVPSIKNSRYLMMTTVPGVVLVSSLLADFIDGKGRLRWLAALVLTGAIAGSLLLLNVSYVYRAENAVGSKWAAAAIQDLAKKDPLTATLPIYCEHHTALLLESLLPKRDIRAVSYHDLSLGRNDVLYNIDQIQGLVIVDHFIINKYVRFSGMKPPDYILDPPSTWLELEGSPHPRDGLPFAVLRMIDRVLGSRLSGPAESLRPDPVFLYRVTGHGSPLL